MLVIAVGNMLKGKRHLSGNRTEVMNTRPKNNQAPGTNEQS